MREFEARLLQSPDDVSLRLVLADVLAERGDPRGELITLQHARAHATDRDERDRLRDSIANVIATGVPALCHPNLELDWELGFVRSAVVTGDAVALSRTLLGHPAGRIVRHLTVAVDEEDFAALAQVIASRPQPSLLGRVSVGHVAEGMRWVAPAHESFIEPLQRALTDDDTLVVEPCDWLSHAQLQARFADDTRGMRNELRILEIGSDARELQRGVHLRVRDGCRAQARAVCDGFSEPLGRLLSWTDESIWLHCDDRTYAGYGNLFRAVHTLAPLLDDVRFTMSDHDSVWIDEYVIRDGSLDVTRGRAAAEYQSSKREFWLGQLDRRPGDAELRRFVALLYMDDARFCLRTIERLEPTEVGDNPRTARARQALDRAQALDDSNPVLWHQRARLARALGDLEGSERAFAVQARLEEQPTAGFDRAMLALALGHDVRAAALIDEVVARQPDRSGARLVAAHLAAKARYTDAANEHLTALLDVAEARRVERTPLREHQAALAWTSVEPDAEDIVRTGRHEAIMASAIAGLTGRAATDGARRQAAAAYLLGWAECFRVRVALDRGRADAERLAQRLYPAAAQLHPLGGSVHAHWALFLEDVDPAQARARLEEGLAMAPYHLGILGTLGAAARAARDYDRALALLERYVTLFDSYHEPGAIRGLSWDYHLTELAIAHYENACFKLYGVAPGENRPPGRPSDEALAAAERALEPALALYPRLSSRQQRESCGVFQLKSIIEEYRDNHALALEWADRAVAANDANAHVWATRAGCLKNLGRHSEAEAACQRSLEIDEAHWYAHYVLACVLARTGGRHSLIHQRLRRVVELWPEGREELETNPDLAPLRDEREFQEIIAR